MMSVKRGEIYWVEFDPVKGNEQGGLRPALVVQNDVGNRFSPTTVVVSITRTLPPKPFPFVVVIEARRERFAHTQRRELRSDGDDTAERRGQSPEAATPRNCCPADRTSHRRTDGRDRFGPEIQLEFEMMG